MRMLKAALDPNNVLNPGKVLAAVESPQLGSALQAAG
jgi:hypothetical protein